jgi:hypothetical protein
VEVVTLHQYIIDLATEKVLTNILDINEAEKQINNELLKPQYRKLKEFVLIDGHKIKIGIKCDIVTDDNIDYAVGLLMTLETIKPGRYSFGREHQLSFKPIADIVLT